MTYMKSALTVSILLSSFHASAETIIKCPASIPAKSIAITDLPEGFKGIGHVTGTQILASSGGVLVGPPREEAQGILIPDEHTQAGSQWTYGGLDGFTDKSLERWAYCAYGDGAHMQLLQKLPQNVKTCKVARRQDTHGVIAITIRCE